MKNKTFIIPWVGSSIVVGPKHMVFICLWSWQFQVLGLLGKKTHKNTQKNAYCAFIIFRYNYCPKNWSKNLKNTTNAQITIYCGSKVVTMLVETHFLHHFGFLSTIIDVFHGYNYYLANTCEKRRSYSLLYKKKTKCV